MLSVRMDGDISSEAEQILRDQSIDADRPGSILRDFESLLAFIGENGTATTGKYYFLPQSRLAELNERMTHPVSHRLKRPQQRSFPNLHGLYLILRASGMGIGVGMPPKGRLMLDPTLVSAWHQLSPAERYFTLLESWLVQGSAEIIAESQGWSSGCMDKLIWVFQKLRNRRTAIADDHRGGPLYGTMELVTLALMELFGWLRLEYGEPKDGEGHKLAAVERLPFGDAMASALSSFELLSADDDDGDSPSNLSVLQPIFQPYFPEWKQNLVPPDVPFREGAYTWWVSLGSAWRRIVATAELCLDDLAMTILKAFEFDADHLYCFELRDTRGRNLRIACPYEEGENAQGSTDEVSLGDLPLPEGGVMTFIFDYGFNWEFTVKLEEVGPLNPKWTYPKVVAKGGRPPAQYEYDEWD